MARTQISRRQHQAHSNFHSDLTGFLDLVVAQMLRPADPSVLFSLPLQPRQNNPALRLILPLLILVTHFAILIRLKK